MKSFFVIAVLIATALCLPAVPQNADLIPDSQCKDAMFTCSSIKSSCNDVTKYDYNLRYCENTCGFCGPNCRARQDSPHCPGWVSHQGFCQDQLNPYGTAMIYCPHACQFC